MQRWVAVASLSPRLTRGSLLGRSLLEYEHHHAIGLFRMLYNRGRTRGSSVREGCTYLFLYWQRKSTAGLQCTPFITRSFPWQQGLWGQHGAHLGPTGPRWDPCWPHEPCYLVFFFKSIHNRYPTVRPRDMVRLFVFPQPSMCWLIHLQWFSC